MSILTRVPGQELLLETCGRGGNVGMSVAVGRTWVGLAVTTSGVEVSPELPSEGVGTGAVTVACPADKDGVETRGTAVGGLVF